MKAIIDSIKTKLAEVTALKFIDENTGQLDYYSPNFPVKFPCALVDIGEAGFSNIGMDKTKKPINRQMGDIIIVFNVANLKLTNTSNAAPTSQKTQAHSIFDIMQAIHEIIQGFHPTQSCSGLIRIGQKRLIRDDGVQEYQIRYTANANDV